MRQIGYLAAAGLYALDHHIERLNEDHLRAKALGELLKKQSYVANVEPVETNIVIFQLTQEISEKKFIEKLKDKKVLVSSMGQDKLRLVTHLDYTDEIHKEMKKIINS